MTSARPDPTANRYPRDYRANRSQVNQAEEIVLHSHVGAKKTKFPPGGRPGIRWVLRLPADPAIAVRARGGRLRLPSSGPQNQGGEICGWRRSDDQFTIEIGS